MSRVSVVMAVCNGEKYLKDQLDSVLKQLSREDELIITIDPSTDGTWKICEDYAGRNPQIRLLKGPQNGIASNFENGLKHASRELIFLSDQDDVWMDGKVEAMKTALEQPGVLLAIHDCIVTDEHLNTVYPSYYKAHRSRTSRRANMIRNSFVGACIAFKRELLDVALPFPDSLPMHDQWLGLAAQKKGKVIWISQPYLLYRRHSDNASAMTHSSLKAMIDWRINLFKSLAQRGLL